MCGRFSQSERVDRVAELFGASPEPDLPAGRYNVAPTDPVRILVETDGARRLVTADWGFRPFWRHAEGRRTPGWINARAETALESPAFGPALRRRRCLVPADAFYEWDRSHRPPQPWAIGPSAEGAILVFAGIWTDARADEPRTAAILTTGPNSIMAPLHHRMPVVLDPRDVGAWLDPEAPLEAVMSLLVPAPDDALRTWQVSPAVNKVGTDGPELLQPLSPQPNLGLA
ncbi:MAG TPA: SOS response-associated peptidase [Candidatus Limnocylindria bacterium]|jgi:putative SOS response-associated peptidase YedK|nr:SOS response-associated peptidase [Candidatus Limnocylindria bacterium]